MNRASESWHHEGRTPATIAGVFARVKPPLALQGRAFGSALVV